MVRANTRLNHRSCVTVVATWPGGSSGFVSIPSFVLVRFALRANKREALLLTVLSSCNPLLSFGAGAGFTYSSLFRIEDVLSGISCPPRSFAGAVNMDFDILSRRRFGFVGLYNIETVAS